MQLKQAVLLALIHSACGPFRPARISMPCAGFQVFQQADWQCQQLLVLCNCIWLLCRLQLLSEVSSHLTYTYYRATCTCLPLTTLALTTCVCYMLPDGKPGVLCVFSLNSWVSCLKGCPAVTN